MYLGSCLLPSLVNEQSIVQMIVIVSVYLYKTRKFLSDFFKYEEQKSAWVSYIMSRFKTEAFTYYSALFCFVNLYCSMFLWSGEGIVYLWSSVYCHWWHCYVGREATAVLSLVVNLHLIKVLLPVTCLPGRWNQALGSLTVARETVETRQVQVGLNSPLWGQSRVEQVPQRGCGVCILRGFQDQAQKSPESHGPTSPVMVFSVEGWIGHLLTSSPTSLIPC